MIQEKVKEILTEKEPDRPKSQVEQFIDWLFDQYDYRFNVITQRPEYSQKDENIWYPVDDIFVNSLEVKARIYGFSKNMASMINTILKSRHIPHQNDIEIYFKNLPRPEKATINRDIIITPTIKAFFDKLKIREFESFDKQTLYKYFQKWMIATVNSALGKKPNDVMLVLMGDQGKMKTSFLRHLTPKVLHDKYYVEGHIDPSLTNNNTANYLCEKFIINIDDQLDQIFNKDFNSLKSIISVSQVTNRRVYSVYDKTRKRIASFVGSVNNTNFLIDSENRRYFVLNVEEIDPTYSTIDPNIMWAEAYFIAQKTDPYKVFQKEDYLMISNIANQYTVQSYEQFLLGKFFRPQPNDKYNTPLLMLASEITHELSKYTKDKLSIRKVGLELKRMRFEQVNSRTKRYDDQPRLFWRVYVKKEYVNEFLDYLESDVGCFVN